MVAAFVEQILLKCVGHVYLRKLKRKSVLVELLQTSVNCHYLKICKDKLNLKKKKIMEFPVTE